MTGATGDTGRSPREFVPEALEQKVRDTVRRVEVVEGNAARTQEENNACARDRLLMGDGLDRLHKNVDQFRSDLHDVRVEQKTQSVHLGEIKTGIEVGRAVQEQRSKERETREHEEEAARAAKEQAAEWAAKAKERRTATWIGIGTLAVMGVTIIVQVIVELWKTHK